MSRAPHSARSLVHSHGQTPSPGPLQAEQSPRRAAQASLHRGLR